MNIEELIKSKQENLFIIENHPAVNMRLSDRILYLDGIALMMSIDHEIHKKEKKYLTTLIVSLDLPKENLEQFINFSKKNYNNSVEIISKSLKRNNLEIIFLLDLLIIRLADNKIRKEETELLTFFAKELEIDETTRKDLESLAHFFKIDDIEGIIELFNKNNLKKEEFRYLFDYYNLEIK